MNKAQIFAVVLCLGVSVSLVAHPQSLAAPADAFEQLRVRASAWFKTTDKKSRRKEMRAMTRALKQPCKYCHSQGFRGYTDRHKISLEMMVLSVENDVECKDCHIGKTELSPMGLIAKRMEKIAKQEGADCSDCHNEKSKFKSLTPRGELYKSMHPNLLLMSEKQEPIKP